MARCFVIMWKIKEKSNISLKGLVLNMSVFSCFYPDKEEKSVYQIDFEEYYAKGYRGIVFDIDNTLVPHGAPATETCIRLFEKLRKIGFEIMLLSNNKEYRVKSFHELVKVNYIYKAGKPNPKNYQKAMEMMGTSSKDTLFIGDQLFTDIWGANRANMRTILVQPIHPKEEIQIIIKRYLEAIVLYFYHKSLKKEGGKNSD